MSGAVATAKAIGEDVETLVVDAVAGLDAEDDEDAHHDAVVSDLLAPSLVETTVPVTWAGTPLVEPGTRVEIKACKRWTSNGTHDIRGRWLCKGREDGQHRALLDAAAVYVLAIYEGTPSGEKALWRLVVIPASLLDEHLRERWYTIDRNEGTMAALSWTALLSAGGDD